MEIKLIIIWIWQRWFPIAVPACAEDTEQLL